MELGLSADGFSPRGLLSRDSQEASDREAYVGVGYIQHSIFFSLRKTKMRVYSKSTRSFRFTVAKFTSFFTSLGAT